MLGFVKCELLIDTVDLEVKIRTFQGTHSLKEDREYHTPKFRPLGSQVKPFEALKVRLSRCIKRRETVAAATAAFVALIFQ